MALEMGGTTRAWLGLIVGAVVVAAVLRLGRAERSVWRTAARWFCGGAGVLMVTTIVAAEAPVQVVAAAGLGIAAPSVAWGLGGPKHDGVSWPHLAFATGLTLAGAVLFGALLPLLPSIGPLHWSGLGDAHGYGSPTKLWWSLVPPIVDVALVVWAAHVLEGARNRRALLRLAEWILTGCTAAVVVLWIGAALAMAPGGPSIRWALLGASATLAAALLAGLALHAPTLLRAPTSGPN